MSQTVLITGCSSGIGRATAERFLDGGWTVYATARDLGEIENLDARGCRTLELDVTDNEEVERAVDRVFDEQGHLDCLVNNAGYGQFGPVEDVPMDGVVEQFDVNTFGPLRLIRAAVPRMRERGRGTVVNVTAGVGGLTVPGLGIYTGSKYGLESVTDALRQETGQFGVDVVTVEPGIVATDFYDRVLEEVAEADRSPAYADLYRVLDEISLVKTKPPGVNSPERVADRIHDVATAENPKPVYRVGPSAKLGTLAGFLVRGRVRDAASRVGLRVLSSDPAIRALRWWRKRRSE
ncbi:SDR family oxidoreductase [Haloprofundus salilacus]|uniref:SDR family oxidoreductase n=1 Tax=Haloprofundus salilacus TaxID=2876190 RepID=UPI001CCC545A|nr:SDR family oxidoreductase [Haloprofundus salilacus]